MTRVAAAPTGIMAHTGVILTPAEGVILGRNTNGREDWKTADGRTLKSIQEAAGGMTDGQNRLRPAKAPV